MEKKICPIMTSGKATLGFQNTAICEEQKCALWVESHGDGHCGLIHEMQYPSSEYVATGQE
jgi:hypothetical protein